MCVVDERYISSQLGGGRYTSVTADPPASVTESQRELLRLVAGGHGNKEIAHRLGVSEPAIKKRLSSLMRRYVVPNRAALIHAVMAAGVLE
jgi:DNA-binding NarL/FixJ family response regulator